MSGVKSISMLKIKQKSYGFTTPVRRITNNITGHKVGGALTGGDCKIGRFQALNVSGKREFVFELNSDESILLFERGLSIVAVGGYFLSVTAVEVCFKIEIAGKITEKRAILRSNIFEKLGLEVELIPKNLAPSTKINITIQFDFVSNYIVQYTHLSFGFVSHKYFIANDLYDHFYNSKKEICFPEQFYFTNSVILDGSVEGDVLITKSCNRCQRFLPINFFNERIQLAFSNHCAAKAPCTHSTFSNYQIKESCLDEPELTKYIKTTALDIRDNLIVSYFGHQLECKACKKFFVNAALNHLRTSTQHREDSLRRRAFEILINTLLGSDWIYFSFREEKGIELDKYIWEKFNRQCFNCEVKIATPSDMDLDHTMPLVYLYPLDATATCLCPSCNSAKSDLFPKNFYSPAKLIELSEITGISLDIINSTSVNETVIKLLKDKIIWFFETFMIFVEYTKVRKGKKVSDSILHSLQKVINSSQNRFDLLAEYDMRKKEVS